MFLKPEELDQKTMTLSSSIYRSQDLHGSLYKRSFNTSSYTTNFGNVLDSTYKLLDEMRDNFKLNIGRPYGLSGLKTSGASYTSSTYKSTSNLRSEYRSEGLFSSHELKRTQYFPKRDTKQIIAESQNLIADIRASLQASKAELALYEDPADLKVHVSQKRSQKTLINKSPSNIKIEEHKEIEKSYNNVQHYILEGNAHRKIAHNLKRSDDQGLQPSSMTFNDTLHAYMPKSPEAEKKVTVLSPRSPSEENQYIPATFGPSDRLAQAMKLPIVKASSSSGKIHEVQDYGKENYEIEEIEEKIPKKDHKKTFKNQRGINLLQNAIKEANAYVDDPNELVEVSELKSEFNSSEFMREQEEGDRRNYLRTNLSNNNQPIALDSALDFDESPKPDIPVMYVPEPQAKVSLKMVPSKSKSKSKENRVNPFKGFEGFRNKQENSQMKDGNKGVKKEGLYEKNRNMQGKQNGLFRSVQK